MDRQAYYQDGRITLYLGDCLEVMPDLPAQSIDAIVTDPPYGLEFMGKDWDAPWKDANGFRRRDNQADVNRDSVFGRTSARGPQYQAGIGFQRWCELWAIEALRVAKPGAHLLAFGGTRTYHRLACAIEDAGWEIRDCIMWVYGSGMPKAWNFSTQYSGEWCDCCGNAVSYSHETAQQETEHDLRFMRSADLPASVNATDQSRKVLQSGMPQSSAPSHRQAWTEPGSGWCEQSGMEWRSIYRAGEGICNDSYADSPKGATERIRAGTYPDSRGDARTSAAGRRRSPPQEQDSVGQSSREPANIQDTCGTLDDGALRNGGCCPRCGKLSQKYRGFSSALKPAVEPIVVARKPLIGTVAANVLTHGTGAINVDACRVPANGDSLDGGRIGSRSSGWDRPWKTDLEAVEKRHAVVGESVAKAEALGRWPANLIHDGSDEVVGLFPDACGGDARGICNGRRPGGFGNIGADSGESEPNGTVYADTGSAARFFYTAKASADERNGSQHPTVKPLALMRYLVRLVTPPDALVLDPFVGSGTTLAAARLESCRAIGIDKSEEYCADAVKRIARQEPRLF